MSATTITLLFLLFAVIMFVLEKIPLGVTSMIVCIGLVVTGVLDIKTAFAGFIDSNVILFVAMFIVGGALFETGMANKIGGINRMLHMDVKLDSFSLNAVTDGEDAIGEAVVKISDESGKTFTGTGLSTDIIESSIRAYVNGINKMIDAAS